MKIKLTLLAAMIGVASLAACGGSGTADEGTWNPFVYEGPTVVTKSEIVIGSGAEAVAGKTVKILLTQWQYKATALDFKGDPYTGQTPPLPYTMTLRIIPGAPELSDAVIGMRVGGKRTAVIPGDMDPGTRPTNSTVSTASPVPPKRPPSVAEIELLEVTN